MNLTEARLVPRPGRGFIFCLDKQKNKQTNLISTNTVVALVIEFETF